MNEENTCQCGVSCPVCQPGYHAGEGDCQCSDNACDCPACNKLRNPN